MMNVVAIDPSLSCTGIVVNDKRFAFVNRKIAHTSKGALNKWFELASSHVDFTFVDYGEDVHDYATTEICKLNAYDIITTDIVDTILDNIQPSEYITRVLMEGYSYSSAAGPLIDLVTFSTLLRHKLYEHTNELEIISPTSLKLEAAKLTYPAIPKGKKVVRYEYRNNEGIAGGSFKKHEMYKALVENDKLSSPYIDFLREHQKEILNYKNIPKPIEDVNDAQILYYVGKTR
jgi:hypothetical protein